MTSSEEPPTITVVLEPGAEPAEPAAVPKRRLAPMLIAGGVTLLLLIGLGAFVGYRLLFAGGPQPAERMPASIAAYVGLELDPSLDQTIKLVKLAKRFPDTDDINADPEKAIQDLLEKLEIKGVDPKQDLATWLSPRIGVGVWADSSNKAFVLIGAASTDDKAARAGLEKVRNGLTKPGQKAGFAVEDHFAVLAIGGGDAQAAAAAAMAEGKKAPLSKADRFVQARKWLNDDQLLVAFVDFGRMKELGKQLGGTFGLGSATDVSSADSFVFGLRASDDGFEGRFRSFGGKQTEVKVDALAKLGELPKESSLSAVVTIPELTDADTRSFDELDSMLGGMLNAPTGPGSQNLTPAEREEMLQLMTKKSLTKQEEARLEDLVLGKTSAPKPTTPAPKLAEVIKALSGATISLSVADFSAKNGPVMQLLAELTSADSAKLLAGVPLFGAAGLSVKADGARVTVSAGEFAPGTGKLADDETFKKAMAGGSGKARVALYLNGRSAIGTFMKLSPITAVGVNVGVEGTDQVGMMRILVG